MERSDFRKAANSLSGSRDTGIQLFCALLRSVGVQARLVCSLQPLAFATGGPTLPAPRDHKSPVEPSKEELYRSRLPQYEVSSPSTDAAASSSVLSPRRRLGHPNAAAYNIPVVSVPDTTPKRATDAPKRIKQSTFPVYWVEVLDVGHQKWQPVDPLVTDTMWKPRVLEPPANDRENSMSYVVAFDADGTARDVTRRYAKAYNSKTRKLRIESLSELGTRWWHKALKPYRRIVPTDLDQIEDNELAASEAREPMPRNLTDFKDHPVYALERHLRRHEVLVPGAKSSGTVGPGSKGPLEKIYRRKDVRIARSKEKWYRLGREVKFNEIPVKWLPRRVKSKMNDDEEDLPESGPIDTPLYMFDQTNEYKPPRVVDGKVPKNKFGNIEIYVPSMVPEGGAHIGQTDNDDNSPAKAAHILGIDYTRALTGFQFKGKHGTAVLNGIVVAKEYEAAVKAVMGGLTDLDALMEEERHAMKMIKMWKRFLLNLRIRERVWAGVDPEERARDEEVAMEQAGTLSGFTDARTPTDIEEDSNMDEDYGGGGFLME
jgi:xeroderma pigmentosum group C-complementing protein